MPAVDPDEPGAPPIRTQRVSGTTFETLPIPTDEVDYTPTEGALLPPAEDDAPDAEPRPAAEEIPLAPPARDAPPDLTRYVLAGVLLGVVLVALALALMVS